MKKKKPATEKEKLPEILLLQTKETIADELAVIKQTLKDKKLPEAHRQRVKSMRQSIQSALSRVKTHKIRW